MPSLGQLHAAHPRILVLDAAGAATTAGLLEPGCPRWANATGEAGKAVFAVVGRLLAEGGVALDDIDAFVFCEGPGSHLGIRTVAMAIRTWLTLRVRPVFAYQSLALAAHAEWIRRPRVFATIADARRDSWHVQTVNAEGTLAPIKHAATHALPAMELLHPAPFRHWTPLPPTVSECPYEAGNFLQLTRERDLIHPSTAPDAYPSQAPAYQKWTGQVHGADRMVAS